MKLSELLHLRHTLLSIDVSQIEVASKKLVVEAQMVPWLKYDSTAIVSSLSNAQTSIGDFRNNVSEFILKLDNDIKELDAIYKERCKKEEVFHLRASVQDNRELRKKFVHDGIKKLVTGRLAQYVSWSQPGIEIGPGDGEWTEYLVALDPLYLVDIHDEFLNSTKVRFNPTYQRRLRTYCIPHADFSTLPKDQFGFVFAWNVFEYFGLLTIKKYLEELFTLLKPGGVIMFSYNNCENYKSVEMFENHFMTYVPNRDLVKIAKDVGYEIISARDEPTMTSWLEIKKPGSLTSIRAGQTLGKIKLV
jgi:SAM-dependent methyltransferase